MKARIFVLGLQENECDPIFDNMLRKTFSPVFTVPEAMEYYGSVKEAISSIGRAFSDSDTVLFFVEKGVFAQVKVVLCRALGLKLGIDAALLETAKNASPSTAEEADFAVRNAGLPEGGIAFGLSDALYTGFGVHKGRQTIVVLPVSADRTGIVLAKSVIPFLNGLYGTALPAYCAEKAYAFALQERISGTDLVVALSETKTTALIRRYLSHTPELSRRFVASAKGEQRGTLPPDEYAVNLSLTAAEFIGAPYGVAMTNAFYTGDDEGGERVVYLSVTSETENTVREVTSFYGESTPDLMERCCGELCALLMQIMDIDEGLLQKTPSEKGGKKKGRGKFAVALILLLAAIAGACLFGWYYFTQHEYTLRDWLQTYIPALVQETEETAAPTETEKTTAPEKTETTTEAPETASVTETPETEETSDAGENT